MVLCAVGGVQSQSVTVDRQIKRYGVPPNRVINKMTAPAPTRPRHPHLGNKLGLKHPRAVEHGRPAVTRRVMNLVP